MKELYSCFSIIEAIKSPVFDYKDGKEWRRIRRKRERQEKRNKL